MSTDLNEVRAPEGEVVYRRVAPTSADDAGRPREPRLDPTLMPLLVGSALLLLFVIVLGNLSVRRVEDTSRRVLDLERQFAARATLLLQLRIALTRLDNEARDRMEAEARHELRPPFDLRVCWSRRELFGKRSDAIARRARALKWRVASASSATKCWKGW